MNDLIKLIDPHLVLIKKEIDTEHNKLTLWAQLDTEGSYCTHCGAWSESVQGHYTRRLTDFTVMGMETELIIVTRKFYCNNPECDHKTFAEPLTFAVPHARKTDRLWDHIDELHTCMSAKEASEIVSDSITSVHWSTLIRHLSKRDTGLEGRKVLVEAICIDDLALRRRFSYATAIIDAITHELLEIIPSRKAEDVAEELEKYTSLVIVSRDGAACFRNGVLTLENGKEIVQITDPFHVLAGCTEACQKYLKAKLPKVIPLNGPVEKKNPEIPSEAAKRKRIRILTVQQLHASGMSVKEIAADQGICEATIRTYLKADPNAVQSGNRQKYAKLIPYLRKIGELLAEGVSVKAIYEAIRERGYTGSIGILYKYVRARKAGNIAVPTEDSPSRALVLKRLYKDLDDIPLLDPEIHDRVLELYPFVAEVFEWVDQLRAIMKSQSTDGLEEWLKTADSFKSSAINSFVNGLQRDRAALEASILLPFSNGPMEGTVNKLKVLRRIMYGRCSFPFFRQKALIKERLRRARQDRLTEKKKKISMA